MCLESSTQDLIWPYKESVCVVTQHFEKRCSLKICRPRQINTNLPAPHITLPPTPSPSPPGPGTLRLRCLPVVAKALTVPVSLIKLISISLSLELIFLLGPSATLMTACLFKLMNGCDHGCCVFKNINRKLWQQHWDCNWISIFSRTYTSTRTSSGECLWGKNVSGKELESMQSEQCKRDPGEKCTTQQFISGRGPNYKLLFSAYLILVHTSWL